MYIQITDHCNMKCAHCCFSCSPRKKRFMSPELFQGTIELINDEVLTIGGGEPTLHPHFFEILGLSMQFETPLIITNGSVTKTAIILNKIATRGAIQCELSLDQFHWPIDHSVKRVFSARGAIHDTSRNTLRSGRAIRTGVWNRSNMCACNDIFIDPDGNIFSCGCRTVKLGNVLTSDHSEIYNKINVLGMYNSICINELDSKERIDALTNLRSA